MINRNYPVILATYLIDSENDRVITIVRMLNGLLILCQVKSLTNEQKIYFRIFHLNLNYFIRMITFYYKKDDLSFICVICLDNCKYTVYMKIMLEE